MDWNWDAISAISQLIGSVAVVFSVLYLALQVHRSTRVARLATQDAAAAALRDAVPRRYNAFKVPLARRVVVRALMAAGAPE